MLPIEGCSIEKENFCSDEEVEKTFDWITCGKGRLSLV